MNGDLGGTRILVFSYFYPPAELPGAFRAVKFIRNFSNGQIHVLAVKPEYYPDYIECNSHYDERNSGGRGPIGNEILHRTGVIDLFRALLQIRKALRRTLSRRGGSTPVQSGLKDNVTEMTESVTSIFNPGKKQKVKDFLYKWLHFPDDACHWLLPALFQGVRIVREERISVIFASGMPWSGLVAAFLVGKLTGVPYIADFRDPWVGNPFHNGKGALMDKLEEKLERWTVRGAALVSANTDPLRMELMARYPDLPKSRFVVLPNGFDPVDFPDMAIPPLSSQRVESLVLVHAGLLYAKRDPAPLIEAIELCKERNGGDISVTFTQMGRVGLEYDFDDRFGQLLKDNTIVRVSHLPYKDCLEKLAAADVLVVIQAATKTQVPSKIYDYLHLNKPILTITPLNGALGHLIRKNGFGAVFDPSDISGISAWLEWAFFQKKKGALSADYAQKQQFDIRRITEELAVHIRSLA